MSVLMALVDFIPVALFLAAAILLQRDLYNKMSKGAFALFAAGGIVVFVAGFLKALWKLLYGLGVCDFALLNQVFFPMQTTGFLLAALGLVALLCHRQGKTAMAVVPPVFDGKMVFVGILVLSVAVLDGCLVRISIKRKSRAACVLFLVSFVLVMAMGYLSTKDFTGAAMNWVAEAVNIGGQGCFLLGALALHKGGLGAEEALA